MTATRELAEGDDPFGALPYEQMFDALATVEAMARQQILNGDSFPIALDEFDTGLDALRRKVVSAQQAIAWSDYRKLYSVPTNATRRAFLAGWDAAAASVSPGIRSPCPEPSEGQDRTAADNTAPEMVAPKPPPNRPAGWYRTMDPAWAARWFGFPPSPADEDRHIAGDGSEWRFSAYSGWWELHAYAPGDQDRDLLTMRDPDRQVTKEGVRSRILAEVAASEKPDGVPDFATVRDIVTRSTKLANTPVDGPDYEVFSRDNLIAAAALLVLAVERLDAPDE